MFKTCKGYKFWGCTVHSGAQNKRDGQQKFDGFCHFLPEPLILQISYVPHFKALTFSSLELQGQRARPPNKAAMPFLLQGTEYQEF